MQLRSYVRRAAQVQFHVSGVISSQVSSGPGRMGRVPDNRLFSPKLAGTFGICLRSNLSVRDFHNKPNKIGRVPAREQEQGNDFRHQTPRVKSMSFNVLSASPFSSQTVAPVAKDQVPEKVIDLDIRLSGEVVPETSGAVGKQNEQAKSLLLDKSTPLEDKYKEYVKRIFSWSVYRSYAGVGEQQLIERKHMDPRLIEMRRLAACFGNPQEKMKLIHVAGTNGKGSVSLKVARGLEQLGFKTGLYTSPHINTFRERVSVNQVLATREHIVQHCEAIFSAIQREKINLRFFEIVTMIALLEFARQGCDYAVLECGIGGHLDATNIVDHPICSVITTIGLDHMDVLGDSVEDIAREKAGVIKHNLPCIIGPTCRDMQPILDRAKAMNASLIQIPYQPSHLLVNNQIVRQVLKIVCQSEDMLLYPQILDHVFNIQQPCRFERIPDRPEKIILDVCHNLQGFTAVLKQIKVKYPQVKKITLAFVISRKKKIDDVIQLFEKDDRVKAIHVVGKPHFKLMESEQGHEAIKNLGTKKLKPLVASKDPESADGNIRETLDHLLVENDNLQNNDELLLICGSFFIMTDVRQYFGMKEDIDEASD